MPGLDPAALLLPVSETEACGPDLDAAGDPAYLHFVARAEGLLTQPFFKAKGEPYEAIDFPAQFEALAKLLQQTRDLRLLTIYARFAILNRDLAGFVDGLSVIAALLKERWDALHPRGADGAAPARMAMLETLDELSGVVLPLQYAPLIETRRHGALSYRTQMIASGEVKAREKETVLDNAAIEQEFTEADLGGLIATRARLTTLRDALRSIRATAVERVGGEQAPRLERLPQLAERMAAFLDAIIVKRDPSATLEPADAAPAPEPDDAAPGVSAGAPVLRGRVASVAGAAKALAAVSAYFSAREPSSPALFLVRQAEQLIGKSFVDVMRILLPARVPQAKVLIGVDPKFSLQLESLSALSCAGTGAAPAAAAGDGAGDPSPGPIETRQAAVGLLEDVGAFYRAVEPSSPIPLLTERARSLIERDFLYLLKDLLPDPEVAPPAKK